jgi:Na+/melibiose symporter-like transporter
VTQKNITLLFVGSFFMTFIASLYSSVLFAVTTNYSGSETQHIRRSLGYLQRNVLIGGLVGLLGATFVIPKLPLFFFLVLDAATFLISSSWIFCVTRKDLGNEQSKRKRFENFRTYFSGLWLEWREGLKSVTRNSELLKVFVMNFIICFGYGVLESSVVSTQKLVLGFSDSLVTFSRSLNRVSAICGTLLLGRWSKDVNAKRSRGILSFGLLVSIVGTGLMVIPNALVFVASNSFYNFGWASLHPTIGSLVARSVSQEYLGRVQSFRSLTINLSILLGNLAVLLLSRFIPVQWLFALTCTCFVFTYMTFRAYKYTRG